MKIFYQLAPLILLFISVNALSFPAIQHIKQNPNYLLIEEASLPMVDVNITFSTGSKDDIAKKGITNYAIKLLHLQKVDNEKIIDSFQKIGALYTSNVTRDSSSITLRFVSNYQNKQFISSQINKMLTLYSVISEEAYDFTKESILNSIENRELEPSRIISYKSNERFFEGTGYAHPIEGYKKDIEKLNSDIVNKHLSKIINKENIKINFVGDINEAEAANFISRTLYNIPFNSSYSSKAKNLNYSGSSDTYNILHDSNQTHISIYIPAVKRTDKNFYNILVANYIFGGSGFGSMLVKEIREKNGLAYSVYSYLMPYNDIGVLKIGMQTKTSNTSKALRILKDEIDKLKKFDIKESEVSIAKNSILKSFELRFDTNKKRLDTLAAINELNMSEEYFKKYFEGIKAVTKESIKVSLQSDIDFENILITTVGRD
ncbi:MAG: hypothetical protein CBE17_00815 [Gammaproteobacteria bacterium TMED257]|nr:MAG: hypothetical protein CBE17_00815 [Gammaproteobacteria bacterium TMED257]|tara:strand:- start:130 stop:1425 length:1296 start_codon:yes stop_codon:yes gene_type:complete